MVQKQKDFVPNEIDDIELGWLAGLWEGEGHFSYDRSQQAHIRMTDRDVILKQKALIERTFRIKPIHLLCTHSGRDKEQDLYGIQTYGATARAIMRLLLPLMGHRRREQIWRALNEIPSMKVSARIIDLVKVPRENNSN
jgi:hypothetical protein